MAECHEQLLADFYQWQQVMGKRFPMEQDEMRQVARSLQGLYEGRTWNESKAPVEAAYGRRITAINREIGLVTTPRLTQLE